MLGPLSHASRRSGGGLVRRECAGARVCRALHEPGQQRRLVLRGLEPHAALRAQLAALRAGRPRAADAAARAHQHGDHRGPPEGQAPPQPSRLPNVGPLGRRAATGRWQLGNVHAGLHCPFPMRRLLAVLNNRAALRPARHKPREPAGCGDHSERDLCILIFSRRHGVLQGYQHCGLLFQDPLFSQLFQSHLLAMGQA